MVVVVIGAASVIAAPAGAVDGHAELPCVLLDTHFVPARGDTIRVRSGDDLQAALDAAEPGDQVVLAPDSPYGGTAQGATDPGVDVDALAAAFAE